MFGWKTKATAINRRATEVSGAYDGGLSSVTHGLMAGTCVASNLGWRPIEALAVGDKVLTFDHGMQEIIEIRRSRIWVDQPIKDRSLWPLVVPEGALGNRKPVTLLADQAVLIESDTACDLYGDPFAVVPARALDGVRGIHREQPVEEIELIAIYFANEQIIYVEGGALVHCPQYASALELLLEMPEHEYDVLDTEAACFLADCMKREDQILATGGAWVDNKVSVLC